jgi:DNA repair protein RecO (recombination protein O)
MPGRPPRVLRTEALVLRHRRLGEADRIVTLLTPHHGKRDAVAKGALRPRSRIAGHLEPLARVEVVLAHGRTLDIVTQAESCELFPHLHADLDRLAVALYLLELTDRLTVEHAEEDTVFGLLVTALSRLERGDGLHLVSRSFELALLDATGFRPEWERCVSCTEPVAERGAADVAAWSALAGGVLCADCAPGDPEAGPIETRLLRVLRAYQRGPYEEAARIRLDPELAARLEQVMHALARATAERDLGTARFVAAVRASAGAPGERQG